MVHPDPIASGAGGTPLKKTAPDAFGVPCESAMATFCPMRGGVQLKTGVPEPPHPVPTEVTAAASA
jgi:hypothetical protein